jgi:D-3-phosphoglycerate dehydrogenase
MIKKVLFLDKTHPILYKRVEELGLVYDTDFTCNKEVLLAKIANYIGIVIRSRVVIDKEIIDAATRLRFIARVGAGLESIDTSHAKKKGIILIAAPEGNRNAVGEHTLGMLLSLLNNINRSDKQIKNGKWLREENRGIELDKLTVGIIGYGNMGKSFAKKLKGFNTRTVCFDIKKGVGDENCTQISLEVLKEKVDVLSIHTPHNELSNKMINIDFINPFKNSFFLINTARGSAVVTEDLVKALKSGKIKGAGLDVLEYEKYSFENLYENKNLPKAYTYLIESDRVILTPHIAGWTVQSKIKLAQTIADKIAILDL